MSKHAYTISPEQHRQLAKTLGRTRAFSSANELLAALDGQRRELESATRRANGASADIGEVAALRRDLAARDHAARMADARRHVAAEDAAEASYQERELAARLGVSTAELI